MNYLLPETKETGVFDFSPDQNNITLDMPDANVVYYPHYLATERANKLLYLFQQQLSWSQDTITMFGRKLLIPRLQAWYGDANAHYTYSALALSPLPWTPELALLRDELALLANCRFNSVLANWYRDGNDSMGMHSDDEPELGPEPIIASLTLGQSRPFIFKHKHIQQRRSVNLEHGSLLVMSGGTQQHWQHGINKTKKTMGDRINLTFRQIK